MNNILQNKKILLGVCGSIAAYKAPLIVRELIKNNAEVKTILTPSAVEFVSPMVLSNLSRNPVLIKMFDKSHQTTGAWHIHNAHWCDIMMIAPCSAATLGKIANGICDNGLTAVTMALPKNIPLIIAPAMDTTMWLHPATQNNINILKKYGAYIIPPAEGELASGLTGPGRMPEINVIIEFLTNLLYNYNYKKQSDYNTSIDTESDSTQSLNNKLNSSIQEITEKPLNSLQDTIEKDKWNVEYEFQELKKKNIIVRTKNKFHKKNVLITAGPTIEKIDDVRFISNFSSGKMGFSIANAFAELGANVTLITGPVTLKEDCRINRINVLSAKEMYETAIKEFPNSHIAVLSAAVSDYTPKEKITGKIKKQEAGEILTINLEATNDILFELGKNKNSNQFLVGFCLESLNEIENGWKKLKEKNCDMMVVNSANKPNSGFQGDNNTITILTKDSKEKSFPTMTKNECAWNIIKEIDNMIV